MVLLVTAGVAAVKGGIAVKQHVETRKNPRLDGDFITAPLSTTKNNDGQQGSLKQSLRGSWTKVAQSVKRVSSQSSEPCKTQEPVVHYEVGQEVRLKHMADARFNGRTALVMQQFGAKGVLVQFITVQHYDDHFETGMQVLPENLEPIEASPSTNNHRTTTDTPKDETNPMLGATIKLQHLSAASDKNGLRGMIVVPPKDMVLGAGRVAVQLFDRNGTVSLGTEDGKNLISVKLENCKVVDDDIG